MRGAIALLFALLCVGLAVAQNGQVQQPFLPRGIVSHQASTATVLANYPRPLLQAMLAVREEYGWVVDFEDPPCYSAFDLVDSTDPKWRQAHPNEPGAHRVRGGAFQSQFPEPSDSLTSPPEEELILKKIVADYNQSGNPGRFRVLKENEGRYAIIGEYVTSENGTLEHVPPILDTPISIPSVARPPQEAVYLILDTLSQQTGRKVSYWGYGNSPLRGAPVVLGGTNVPARTLLVQAMNSSGRTLVMDLSFIADANQYFLAVFPARLAKYNSFDRKIGTIPIN